MKTKTLLLTGFVPFLNFTINPTEQIANELDQQTIGNYKVHSSILPVDFNQSAAQLLHHINDIKPDAVISLGLAAGRAHITPERIAINCKDAGGAPDNNGVIHQDEPIDQSGPAAYFSTLPIRDMVNHLTENQYPAKVSNTAGTYLCNNVMYAALHYLMNNQTNIPAGFIHIPASHELAVQLANTPSWSQQDLTNAIKLSIETLN
ncbi:MULTISPECIES: pyroglutamyl-peptidase I [unclassified Sutcliffiella]|uniref:pyroglutamyl-peptidase I n=1 Tax=unclassified Sutcliffiella TaxID=2837532 RepID=UPI0030D2C9CA